MRELRRRSATLLTGLLLIATVVPAVSLAGAAEAAAAECDSDGDGGDGDVIVDRECRDEGDEPSDEPDELFTGTRTESRWKQVGVAPCLPPMVVAQQQQREATYEDGQLVSATPWEDVGLAGCRDLTVEEEPPPEVTAEDVLAELRRMPLPELEPLVQPVGYRTLVQLPTIFYVDPPAFADTVTLLGQQVDVVAEPARYVWTFGDGATRSTTTPGRPFPAYDIVHTYTEVGDYEVSVDVVYRARFSVEGGPMQPIDADIVVVGPATTLTAVELPAVLRR